MIGTHVTADELVDYLHGELPIERDAAVAMHLAHCADCRSARDREAALTEMVRAAAMTQQRSAPTALAASIRTASRITGRSARVSRLARAAFAVPVAVAAAVLIWIGVRSFTENQPKTTIAAGYLVNHHAMSSAITPFADDGPIPPVFTADDAPH